MKDQVVPRHPHLEVVKDDLNRLKLMWGMCCASPILYLFFAQLVQQACFSADEMGFARLTPATYKWFFGSAIALGVAVQLGMLWVRRTHRSKALVAARNPHQLLAAYQRRTVHLMLLSEVVVILGFTLFLLNGQAAMIFGFGIAGMLLYAQSYPSERELNKLAHAS